MAPSIPSTDEIPRLFILPKDTSPPTRIITLSHPRTGSGCRYLFCPDKGIYEFTKVAAPKAAPRSLLLARPHRASHIAGKESSSSAAVSQEEERRDVAKDSTSAKPKNEKKEAKTDLSKGYMTKTAELFIATPFDPLFLVLLALQPAPITSGSEFSQKQLFRSFEDHVDSITTLSSSSSNHFSHVLQSPTMQAVFEARMDAVCDSVEAGDEKMYRLSMEKLFKELLRKAEQMAVKGLPASLEDKFVTRALEMPITPIRREENSSTCDPPAPPLEDDSAGSNTDNTLQVPEEKPGESMLGKKDSIASLSRTTSLVSSASSQSTGATSTTTTDGISAPSSKSTISTENVDGTATEEIIHLLRLRTAIEYITTNYLPEHLQRLISSAISSGPSPITTTTTQPSSTASTTSNSSSISNISNIINFQPLQTHLTHLSTLRQEAMTSRYLLLMGDNCSRKRAMEEAEDGEAARERDRKRIKEEEEKKNNKSRTSRGVRDLKKVDVSGMKKLSSFFHAGAGAGGSGSGGGSSSTRNGSGRGKLKGK